VSLFRKALIVLLVGLFLQAPVSASEFRKFARKEQVAASDVIAVGRVVSVGSSWAPDHSAIYTECEIEIEDLWKGSADGGRVVVRTPGGAVGNVAGKVDGAAEFAAGERVLVFLKRSGAAFEPVGMRFGKYEIVGDGAEAAVVGNLPTDVEAAQRFAQITLRLDDVRAEVAALVGGGRK